MPSSRSIRTMSSFTGSGILGGTRAGSVSLSSIRKAISDAQAKTKATMEEAVKNSEQDKNNVVANVESKINEIQSAVSAASGNNIE